MQKNEVFYEINLQIHCLTFHGKRGKGIVMYKKKKGNMIILKDEILIT